jgi:DNA-directed RNA polymerase subunit F
MIGKGASGKRPVPFAEALEILEERQKDEELGYEQKLAYDHIKKFVAVGPAAAKKARAALMELGVSEHTAVKITDIMPVDVAQLKHILVKEKKSFEDEDIKAMMEIVEANRGK